MVMLNFEKVMKANKMSVTEPRRVIFSVLAGSSEPMSAKQLQSQVSLTDRATVYRTLASFEAKGVVKKLQDSQEGLYELVRDDAPSDYFVCSDCKSIERIKSKDIAKSISKSTSKAGYQLAGYDLIVRGLCNHCQ